MSWQEVEDRIRENDAERPVPHRSVALAVLQNNGLRPNGGATKYMVGFDTGDGERLVWELSGGAQNFFVAMKWNEALRQAGMACDPRPFIRGERDGKRHSGLNRAWSFPGKDCLRVLASTAEDVQRLCKLLQNDVPALVLEPAAVSRWIEHLRAAFPGLDSFNKPDPDFDMAERSYKLESAAALDSALHNVSDNREFLSAVVGVLSKSNLLQWRAYWSMSPKGDGNLDEIAAAIRKLAEAAKGPANGHAQALSAFVETWMAAVPKGQRDHARQIGEFLLMHLSPDEGIYIRHSVREDLWREGYGKSFDGTGSLADIYSSELQFMRDVRVAFEERGLAPRDMIDVQSALWVIHNHKADEKGETTSASLSRDVVEGAMDAYDLYRKSQHHNEIFDGFAEPRDYWVRSTRERDERVYPTKPLIGFILKRTELNGGWGQKSDAAARLHNAGFVIVDQADNPVMPPERYDHLLNGADRVRLCALNYFIEPAREQNAHEVSIPARDLASAIGLKDAFPNICQALGGEKFQQLARVPAPTYTQPNPSSSTVFTYKLSPQAEADDLTDATTKLMPSATNLILYGPPGTGKTYHTAWEAVRLCLGEVADDLEGQDKRHDLMAEYRRLVDTNRIEFITFHQSMSYEEFVEGLRPSTRENAIDGALIENIPAGFHLKPYDGVFKRICERAERDVGEPGNLNRLDRSRRIIRLGLTGSNWREKLDLALREQRIEWPHGGDTDWSPPEYDSWEAIKFKRQENEPGVLGNHPTVYGTWLFRGAEVGEYIALTVGKGKIVALGRLSGEYSFEPRVDGQAARHLRAVHWLWHDAAGVEGMYGKDFTSFHTAYPLLEDHLNWDDLDRTVFGAGVPAQRDVARPYVLIIDEINRANISKVFGELITLLEPDKRLGMTNEICLTLPYSKKRFGVPANLHIIGTMNTADRSIALLDTALRRRFNFRELMPDPTVLSDDVEGINLQKLLRTINERIEYLFDREHQIGHAYFTGCATRDDVEAVMRHKVIPLLAEYFYEDWSRVAAILGDTKQDKPRFLLREDMTAPEGIENDSFAGPRQRWRVKPERDSNGNGSFDFTEFEA